MRSNFATYFPPKDKKGWGQPRPQQGRKGKARHQWDVKGQTLVWWPLGHKPEITAGSYINLPPIAASLALQGSGKVRASGPTASSPPICCSEQSPALSAAKRGPESFKTLFTNQTKWWQTTGTRADWAWPQQQWTAFKSFWQKAHRTSALSGLIPSKLLSGVSYVCVYPQQMWSFHLPMCLYSSGKVQKEMKRSHEGKSAEIITKVKRGDRRALAWGIPTSWFCAVCQEKPQPEGGCDVTERFREAKEKGRKGGNCAWLWWGVQRAYGGRKAQEKVGSPKVVNKQQLRT